jgi:hypothetical protein
VLIVGWGPWNGGGVAVTGGEGREDGGLTGWVVVNGFSNGPSVNQTPSSRESEAAAAV